MLNITRNYILDSTNSRISATIAFNAAFTTDNILQKINQIENLISTSKIDSEMVKEWHKSQVMYAHSYKQFCNTMSSVCGLNSVLFYVLTINCYHSTRTINLAKEV